MLIIKIETTLKGCKQEIKQVRKQNQVTENKSKVQHYSSRQDKSVGWNRKPDEKEIDIHLTQRSNQIKGDLCSVIAELLF